MPTRGVITYLAQERHSSYGRDSLGMLKQSVSALFRFYNRRFGDDVLFFHTGLNVTLQQAVLGLCEGAHAQFHLLAAHHFELPPRTPPPSKWKQAGQFSAGYRHMIRFYTMGIWEVIRDAGYAYVMRMDEDSYLWSPIGYNLFDFMARQGIEYAYRLAAWEHGWHGYTGDIFFKWLRDWVAKQNLSTGWLLDSCSTARRHIGDFKLAWCGEPYGVYNNFFISSVAFWLRPDVQRYLEAVNQSHAIYTLRFNDILWQSSALKLFMEPKRVFMFQDFAYEHITFRDVSSVQGASRRPAQCAHNGAFTLGSDGEQYIPARRRADELMRYQTCTLAEGSGVTLGATRGGWSHTRRCLTRSRRDRTVFETVAFGGAAFSTEQPFCDRKPAPYFCGRRPSSNGTSLHQWHAARVCSRHDVCDRYDNCYAVPV